MGAPIVELISDTDPVITVPMMKANTKFFNNFGTKTKLVDIGVVHMWPIAQSDKPNPCVKGVENPQGNGACSYDFTGEMLKHFYFNMPQSKINETNWKPKAKSPMVM